MKHGAAVGGVEGEEAAVLEEAADHAAHADVLAQLRHARPQRADAAHEELDLRPCRGSGVELVDHLRVRQAVDLDPDPRLLARLGRSGDQPDLLDQPLAERERRHEQLAELARPPESGQVVEEVGDVGGDVLVGGEEPVVLVGAGGDGVVVAGAQVDVAAQPARLAPHDERRLRVDLEAGEAVDDVDARLLERARPLDVAALVAARLDLDEADGLLAALRGVDQRRHERRVVARPVHRRLDRDHLGIGRRAVDVRLEARRERVVGVVDEEVARADRGELLGGGLDRVPGRPAPPAPTDRS